MISSFGLIWISKLFLNCFLRLAKLIQSHCDPINLIDSSRLIMRLTIWLISCNDRNLIWCNLCVRLSSRRFYSHRMWKITYDTSFFPFLAISTKIVHICVICSKMEKNQENPRDHYIYSYLYHVCRIYSESFSNRNKSHI